jgi:nitroreductase
MNVIEAIETRRASRSLVAVRITDELIEDLATSAQLAPSCFNYQPWKFVFVYAEDMLARMRGALSKGNEWVYAASLIIAVFGKREDDCNTQGREYYLFDMGQASAFLELRATELGLVAHPIAGFSESKVKEILGIPDEYKVITLINVGKKSDKISPVLSEKQIEWERNRPERKRLEEFIFKNRFSFKAENKQNSFK